MRLILNNFEWAVVGLCELESERAEEKFSEMVVTSFLRVRQVEGGREGMRMRRRSYRRQTRAATMTKESGV